MQELADGIHVATGSQNANAGLITTSEGAILVDTLMLPDEAQDWARTIRRIAGGAVLFMILTDQYFDHVLGTSSFDCPIIAHELAWKELRSYSDETFQQRLAAHLEMLNVYVEAEPEELRPRVPELMVSGELRILRGEREIRLIHLGGHTPASIAVYLPRQRILFSGDIVVCGQHPFTGQANTKQWLEALDRIRSMDVETIVPGHGPICGMEATLAMTDYLIRARERVRELYLGGATRRETVEKAGILELLPVPADQLLVERQKVRLGVEHMYAEVRKEESKSRR